MCVGVCGCGGVCVGVCVYCNHHMYFLNLAQDGNSSGEGVFFVNIDFEFFINYLSSSWGYP